MTDLKIITEPTVYLIGKNDLDWSSTSQFFRDEETTWECTSDEGTELLCELAGRICYMSFGEKQGRKTTEAYLANIIESEHGSVLEHAVFNFLVTGVSRSFSHELVRHRAGFGYSQLSQRYVDESETAFVMPSLVYQVSDEYPDEITAVEQIWTNAMRLALSSYVNLADQLSAYLEDKYPDLSKRDKRIMARQAARSVLPNATETKVFFTVNARALRHFLEYRGSRFAEAEIRTVAITIALIMKDEAPNLFGDYEIIETEDGIGAVQAAHTKV